MDLSGCHVESVVIRFLKQHISKGHPPKKIRHKRERFTERSQKMSDAKQAVFQAENRTKTPGFGQLVVRTPLQLLNLPRRRKMYIKNETRQRSGAFKLRGSFMALSRREIPNKAVTTASTGNHAIGLSTASRAFGYRAEIFVPDTCPTAKLNSIRKAGGNITLVKGSYEDAVKTSKSYAMETGASYIPSFDDHDVIAGNQEIFSEISDDLGVAPKQVIVPIGGGGLLTAALKSFNPDETEIIGVEFEPYKRVEAFRQSGICGQIPKPRTPVPPSIEGISVLTVGEIPFENIMAAKNLRIVQVNEGQLRNASRFLWHNAGVKAELAACSAVAACLENPGFASSGICAGVVTGGNIDESVFESVINSSKCKLPA